MKYCSAKCGRAATALKAAQDSRDRVYSARIEACRKAIIAFLRKSVERQEKLRPRWRHWTADRATSLLQPSDYPVTVSQTFITRELNRGRLKVPAILRNF
jgi:hypothetical protein